MGSKTKRLKYKDLWKGEASAPTAAKNLDLVLGSAFRLPLAFWRENFLFAGMADESLMTETNGLFPIKPREKGTHPVFALRPLPSGIGFAVCPCSTKSWQNKHRWIEKGTRLLHTNRETDRRSYLIEDISFNMPASVASRLRFQGEVPPDAIISPPAKRLKGKK